MSALESASTSAARRAAASAETDVATAWAGAAASVGEARVSETRRRGLCWVAEAEATIGDADGPRARASFGECDGARFAVVTSGARGGGAAAGGTKGAAVTAARREADGTRRGGGGRSGSTEADGVKEKAEELAVVGLEADCAGANEKVGAAEAAVVAKGDGEGGARVADEGREKEGTKAGAAALSEFDVAAPRAGLSNGVGSGDGPLAAPDRAVAKLNGAVVLGATTGARDTCEDASEKAKVGFVAREGVAGIVSTAPVA